MTTPALFNGRRLHSPTTSTVPTVFAATQPATAMQHLQAMLPPGHSLPRIIGTCRIKTTKLEPSKESCGCLDIWGGIERSFAPAHHIATRHPCAPHSSLHQSHPYKIHPVYEPRDAERSAHNWFGPSFRAQHKPRTDTSRATLGKQSNARQPTSQRNSSTAAAAEHTRRRSRTSTQDKKERRLELRADSQGHTWSNRPCACADPPTPVKEPYRLRC